MLHVVKHSGAPRAILLNVDRSPCPVAYGLSGRGVKCDTSVDLQVGLLTQGAACCDGGRGGGRLVADLTLTLTLTPGFDLG